MSQKSSNSLNPSAKTSQYLDFLFLNRFSGPLIFIVILFIVFYCTFVFGAYPQGVISAAFDTLSDWISTSLSDSMFTDMLCDGIITGVGGVVAFLPNILILFMFISILDRSGYMSRAVKLMDNLMRKINLRGYSFVPLLMSFGCSVPAIMAAGSIENRRHRIITILIIPFMSCSATLPAYILVISSCFPHYAGMVLFSLYLFGIITAVGVALVLNHFIQRSAENAFTVSLRPYTIPSLRNVAMDTWRKAEEYLRKISGIILIASVLMWALRYFPKNSPEVLAIREQQKNVQRTFDLQISHARMQGDTVGVKALIAVRQQRNNEFNHAAEKAQLRNSYIAALGRFIEPVLRPLGFEWQMGVALLSGIAAKEVLVSSLNVLYASGASGINPDIFTPVTAIAFMLFIFLYTPCVGALMAVRRATGKIKWVAVTFLFTTSVAWVVAFIVSKTLPLLFNL